MNLLEGLNPQQKQAVIAGGGPILVLAGPGSGKTRVLTHRIAYLIGTMGVRPYNLLAVTFTNKAAREMEQRVANLLGQGTFGLTLGTFHSVCARILRRETDRLPFESNFVIYDQDDQFSLVKQAIKDLNIDDTRFRPSAVHASISRAKNELILPKEYPQQTYRDEVVTRVYEKYQQMLQASNALDFDDLLLWTARLLDEHPEVRDRYARRFEYVLVDEFQDTNMAQYILLKHLASHHRNIFVVGDIDQSIYRWRGADYRNIRRFEDDFPDPQVILLEQNYRSTQRILDVATAVIDQNPHRVRKRLFTERGDGQKVTLHEAYNDHQEAEFVVDTIATQTARGGYDPGDFAVMYRTNAQSRVLEETFLRANLPYKLVGAQRFYGRREVKDIISYLRLVHNPADEISLARAINTPPRGIGDKTIETLRTQARRANLTPGEVLLDLAREDASPFMALFPARAARALAAFGILFKHWRELAADAVPLALMDQILADTHYQAFIDDGTDEGNGRWENIGELRRVAADYQEKGLVALLENIALISDQDTIESRTNVPTLLTLHAAKGLEFPVVFIIGLEEGTLPHSRSMDDPEAMAEERRLFYVGITRARDRLFILHANNRSAYGYTEPADSSRFLEDIPDDLVASTAPTTSAPERPKQSMKTEMRWDSVQAAQPAAAIKAQYQAGMRVRHPSWGEGMVLKSIVQGGDESVDIFFQEVGLKRVMASLARLERMEK